MVPSLPMRTPTQDGGHQQQNNSTPPQAFPAFTPSDGGQPQQQRVATPLQAFLAFNPSSGGQQQQQQKQSITTLPQAFPAFSPSGDGQQQQQNAATPPPTFPAFNLSDPAVVATLHLDFQQPPLASHLAKAMMTAITSSEYVDFATLLPISSLLEEARNSQLQLQYGTQGVTIPLPANSKRPKLTSIEKWLDAFAIFSSVLVSVYPSCATALIAYQQLFRDASEEVSQNGVVCL